MPRVSRHWTFMCSSLYTWRSEDNIDVSPLKQPAIFFLKRVYHWLGAHWICSVNLRDLPGLALLNGNHKCVPPYFFLKRVLRMDPRPVLPLKHLLTELSPNPFHKFFILNKIELYHQPHLWKLTFTQMATRDLLLGYQLSQCWKIHWRLDTHCTCKWVKAGGWHLTNKGTRKRAWKKLSTFPRCEVCVYKEPPKTPRSTWRWMERTMASVTLIISIASTKQSKWWNHDHRGKARQAPSE